MNKKVDKVEYSSECKILSLDRLSASAGTPKPSPTNLPHVKQNNECKSNSELMIDVGKQLQGININSQDIYNSQSHAYLARCEGSSSHKNNGQNDHQHHHPDFLRSQKSSSFSSYDQSVLVYSPVSISEMESLHGQSASYPGQRSNQYGFQSYSNPFTNSAFYGNNQMYNSVSAIDFNRHRLSTEQDNYDYPFPLMQHQGTVPQQFMTTQPMYAGKSTLVPTTIYNSMPQLGIQQLQNMHQQSNLVTNNLDFICPVTRKDTMPYSGSNTCVQQAPSPDLTYLNPYM
jgi:hypothetical protein